MSNDMNAFSYLNMSPSDWAVTPGRYTQTCSSCNKEMMGTVITRVRGPWEHFDCVLEHFNKFWATRDIVQLKSKELRDVIHSNPGTWYMVMFDPTKNNRVGVYSVMEVG